MRDDDLIRLLALRPHPEGGHYAETFRAAAQRPAAGGMRADSTSIYFLLRAGEASRWHRVAADEAWHWYEGGDLELLTCAGAGQAVHRQVLGPVAADGRRPQQVVPAGCWQAARPLAGHVLVGCTVAPGFDFADFALIDHASAEAAWLRARAEPRLVDGVSAAPPARPRS